MSNSTMPTSFSGAASASLSPGTQPTSAVNVAAVDIAATSQGIATKYWLELVAYPSGSTRRLWLLVNNSWKKLDNPNATISDLVQNAFLGTGSNVRVWFNTSSKVIVGLVVEGN